MKKKKTERESMKNLEKIAREAEMADYRYARQMIKKFRKGYESYIG